MKTLCLLIFVFFAEGIICQQYSEITYGSGTQIDVQPFADVCANNIIVSGSFSGGGTFCTGPLPVTLSEFTAIINKNDVVLNWKTETELNNSGFDVERKKGETPEWTKIGFVQGNGTTNNPSTYSFDDKKLQSGIYMYRLKQIDYNGSFEYFELSSDVVISAPNHFGLSQNYPNPSNPKCRIDYEIPVNGKVTIKVFDTLGKEIKELVNEIKDAGYYTAEFDGSGIASGVYFYRLTAEAGAEKFVKTMKMILVK